MSEVLQRVRERLSDPRRWTRGADARDADGDTVGVRNAAAVCWCLKGALAAEWDAFEFTKDYELLGAAMMEKSRSPHPVAITTFNDTHTHAEVLALIDRALEMDHVPN